MSYTKTVNNANSSSSSNNNNARSSAGVYRMTTDDDESTITATSFISNAFPMRKPFLSVDYEDGWITAYKNEKQKYFDAILTNQKLDQIQKEIGAKTVTEPPKRQILKKINFPESQPPKDIKYRTLDGFYLMQQCCVEDPLDISSIDLSDKNLNQIKEEDMAMFENLNEIIANENCLLLESFKCFENLTSLSLSCNNIKTIRLKYDYFQALQSLDLSYNNLNPIDVAHLGILKNLKTLKLTGNNLTYLPDTFSKYYVYTQDNKKVVSERFSNLEELYLDKNRLREEDSFDVLSVLKKLKRLHLNTNCITCIPKLKIYGKVHVYQEFNKSYHKRKSSKKQKSATSRSKRMETKMNESIVKDLDRPSSEMNIHHSNTWRNSFIIEEDEHDFKEDRSTSGASPKDREKDERMDEAASNINTNTNKNYKKSSIGSGVNTFEKTLDMPFPELLFINLADNQISEEDDLIGLASWPSLNEIILYGNPIIYNNVGFTPLIKQYLIDRLGINIKRLRPLKPLKTPPLLVPKREERLVETKVPKISKIPVELRMLTYSEEPQKATGAECLSARSNLSSMRSFDEGLLNNYDNKKSASNESFDTVGHKNDLFKPFKQDKTTNNQDDETNNKFDSFFMTQTSHDEAKLEAKRSPRVDSAGSRHDEVRSPRTRTSSDSKADKQTESSKNRTTKQSSNKTHKYLENYEQLLDIENEEQIKVPKDINGSIKVLRQMLDNPIIVREPCKELDKPQTRLIQKVRNDNKANNLPQTMTTQPKVSQINEILDTLKERKTISEIKLNINNIKSGNGRNRKAQHLYSEVQNKYDDAKFEFNSLISKLNENQMIDVKPETTES